MRLTDDQRRRAKEKLARHRGIGPETITNESVDLAFANGNPVLGSLLTEVNTPSSSAGYDGGWNSGTCSTTDSGSSSSSDSGSSGGGCD